MAHQLVIRLLDDVETDSDSPLVEWGLIHPELKRLMDVNISPLADIKPSLESKYASLLVVKTIVLVPGNKVRLSQVNIPSKQTRQIQQALPFMLEDVVVDDIDNNFIAVGPRDSSGELAVAIVNHEQLALWLKQLSDAQLKADVMLADTLLVPRDGDKVTLLTGEHLSWLLMSPYQGLRFSNTLMPTILGSLDAEELDRGIMLLSAGGNAADAQLGICAEQLKAMCKAEPESSGADDEGLLGHSLPADMAVMEDLQNDAGNVSHKAYLTPLHAFAEEIFKNNSSLNKFSLLQGLYKPKGPGLSIGFNWKPLAVAASVLFVLNLGLDVLSASKLRKEAEMYDQQAEALYRSFFPNDKRIVDVKSQTLAHLRRAGSADGGDVGLLALLHPTGKTFQQFNKNQKQTPLVITRIAFEERLNELRLDIHAKKFDQLDQLKVGLEKQGLRVEIGSAVSQGDGIQGRMMIKKT